MCNLRKERPVAELNHEELKALLYLNRKGGGGKILSMIREGIPPSEILKAGPAAETLFRIQDRWHRR
jgi:hypothetical protein